MLVAVRRCWQLRYGGGDIENEKNQAQSLTANLFRWRQHDVPGTRRSHNILKKKG
jgi:hypothetical protein